MTTKKPRLRTSDLSDEILAEDPDNYALIVGDRAHRISGHLLLAGPIPTDRLARVRMLLEAGRDVMAEYPAPNRARAVLAEATSSAAAYFARFLPPAPWRFEGAEVSVTSGRLDLIFVDPRGRRLIDELKFGTCRSSETALRPQIDKYLDAGEALWGEDFVGLRLCAVRQPTASRFYHPANRYSISLTDTEFFDMGAPS